MVRFEIASDITRLKQLEDALKRKNEDLERSNKELEQFAYVASHDLQEPLRMVTSYLQLLERRYKDKLDSDANDFIHFAVDGASRMKALVEGLLRFSRVQSKGKPFKPTDVNGILRAVLKNLEAVIEESGAKITYDPLPTVMADDLQLTQLFQNLIGNAIKFRDKSPPEVHISAVPVERFGSPGSSFQRTMDAQQEGYNRGYGTWKFSVSDNGIGIAPEYGDRLFQIFQRLHPKGEYPGTGIGLAICKKVVELHGGRIWMESEPGKGSTFCFTLFAKKG